MISHVRAKAWAPKAIDFRSGPDIDGYGFCSLCGHDAPIGVLGIEDPPAPMQNKFYCCFECARKIGRAVPTS
jgi:hypothetical protein